MKTEEFNKITSPAILIPQQLAEILEQMRAESPTLRLRREPSPRGHSWHNIFNGYFPDETADGKTCEKSKTLKEWLGNE